MSKAQVLLVFGYLLVFSPIFAESSNLGSVKFDLDQGRTPLSVFWYYTFGVETKDISEFCAKDAEFYKVEGTSVTTTCKIANPSEAFKSAGTYEIHVSLMFKEGLKERLYVHQESIKYEIDGCGSIKGTCKLVACGDKEIEAKDISCGIGQKCCISLPETQNLQPITPSEQSKTSKDSEEVTSDKSQDSGEFIEVAALTSKNHKGMDLMNYVKDLLEQRPNLDLIVFPEYSCCSSYPPDDPVVKEAKLVAKSYNVNILLATVPSKETLDVKNENFRTSKFSSLLAIDRSGNEVFKKLKTMGSDWCHGMDGEVCEYDDYTNDPVLKDWCIGKHDPAYCQAGIEVKEKARALALSTSKPFILTTKQNRDFKVFTSICADYDDLEMIDQNKNEMVDLFIWSTVMGPDIGIQGTELLKKHIKEYIYPKYVDSGLVKPEGYFIVSDASKSSITSFKFSELQDSEVDAQDNYVYARIKLPDKGLNRQGKLDGQTNDPEDTTSEECKGNILEISDEGYLASYGNYQFKLGEWINNAGSIYGANIDFIKVDSQGGGLGNSAEATKGKNSKIGNLEIRFIGPVEGNDRKKAQICVMEKLKIQQTEVCSSCGVSGALCYQDSCLDKGKCVFKGGGPFGGRCVSCQEEGIITCEDYGSNQESCLAQNPCKLERCIWNGEKCMTKKVLKILVVPLVSSSGEQLRFVQSKALPKYMLLSFTKKPLLFGQSFSSTMASFFPCDIDITIDSTEPLDTSNLDLSENSLAQIIAEYAKNQKDASFDRVVATMESITIYVGDDLTTSTDIKMIEGYTTPLIELIPFYQRSSRIGRSIFDMELQDEYPISESYAHELGHYLGELCDEGYASGDRPECCSGIATCSKSQGYVKSGDSSSACLICKSGNCCPNKPEKNSLMCGYDECSRGCTTGGFFAKSSKCQLVKVLVEKGYCGYSEEKISDYCEPNPNKDNDICK